jgi:lipopolysaccharide export system protein LptA
MRVSVALLLLLAAPALPAGAQTRHDASAPVDFDAPHMEVQDKAGRALLSGGVAIRQAEMTLDAQRVTVAFTGQVVDGHPQISRMDAAGDVRVARPDQTARGAFATYDLNRRVITMIGGVSLTQGANTVNGGRLTINLDTGRAVIDGSAVGGATTGAVTATRNGRVTGTFSVPDRK